MYFQPSNTHLEEVILMHNTAVGQSLDQLICQSGFASISDSKWKKTFNKTHH